MPDRLHRHAGKSVLIIDDNPTNVALLQALLAAEGLTMVHTEADSRRAEWALAEQSPDLVLLDLHMPGVDGFTVLDQIQQYAAGTYLPVLVMTADTTRTARDAALARGAQDFLTKPLDTTEAILRIGNLLDTRNLYGELRSAWAAAPAPSRDDVGAHPALARVEKVLRNRSIAPVLQPVVDLVTGRTVGHEGLSRFPDDLSRRPDHWFRDAFDVGLGVDLEWLAASAVLGQLGSIAEDAFLAVNMSPATVLHLLDEAMCDGDICQRIVVELTEHVPVEDYPAIDRAFADMRSRGARLAADDLGSGYAGFRHLIRLQPDIIKLDISLISGIHLDRGQRALARALVAFADDVGAQVIAEGVELAEELSVLIDIGVPWAQGFYLGLPVSPDGVAPSAAPLAELTR